MDKRLEVIQNGYKDCGPACMLSIIKYYGGYISYEELVLLLKTDNNGTTAYNLINGCRNIGFDGYGIKYTYEDIISNNYTLPIIAHVIYDNIYHYIVIYKVNTSKKYLYVMDPNVGNIKLSFDKFKNIYQGTSIVIYPVKKIVKVETNNAIIDTLKTFLFLERKTIIINILISVLLVIFSLFNSIILKLVIDYIVPNYSYAKLIIFSFLFLNLLFFKSIISYLRNSSLIRLANNLNIKINNQTIRHVFSLPYQFFKNKSTSEVLSRVNDVRNVNNIISEILINISIDLILIICSMIVILSINMKLFLIVLFFVIVYFIISKSYSKLFKKQINDFQVSECKYIKLLSDAIEGYESNKNINILNEVCKTLEVRYKIYVQKHSFYEQSLNSQMYFKDIVMNICTVVSIFISVIYINEGILTLGNFILFNSVLNYFLEPIKNILDLEPNISYIKNTFNRLNDLLITRGNMVSDTDEKIKGNIVFDNISYSYNNIDNIFEGVSFNIKYGSLFLIKGSSGNGKSTLVKLLLKYIKDYKGKIMIDGINLLDIDENVISSSFTYVSQNDYLNNDILKNNIICNRNISDKKYEEVLKICNVDKIRDSKKLRNNFLIEDNGFNISGGEKQKIILARALLKESNYIILDEALSEVGYIEEIEILNKIISYYKDKTIIYITHKEEVMSLFNNKYCLERRKHDKE